MSTFKDFFQFLKTPSFENQLEINSFSYFYRLVWSSFLIILLIDTLVYLAITYPLKHFNLFPTPIEIYFSYYTIIKLSLVFPLLEELIFRLPLIMTKRNLSITASLILFVLIYRFGIYVSVLLSGGLFIFLFFTFGKISSFNYKIGIFSKRYFIIILYSQALIFGFLHLNNYTLDLHHFYLFPFFIVSHIIIGLFFGYLRVRYSLGIYICIVVHIILNGLNCLILIK